MGKLIFFSALAFLVYYLFLRNAGRKTDIGNTPSAEPKVLQMVRCAQCGLNLPENDSLQAENLYYCCEQHRGLGPLKPTRR